jgi:hypothetical protein
MLKDWLQQKKHLQFINATAGGQPRNPQLDASYLTVYLADHAEGQAVGIFSLSEKPTTEEQRLLKTVWESPCIVVSGIGAPNGAYCLEAMKDAIPDFRSLEGQLLGEFLYHPILLDGSVLWDGKSHGIIDSARGALLVKEDLRLKSASKTVPKTRPIFASLFSVDTIRNRSNRPDVPPRRVVGIIHDTPENRDAKARLLTRMLLNNYFTHVAMSVDLGAAVVQETLKSQSVLKW